MPRKALKGKKKGRAPRKKVATQTYVKQVVGRAIGVDNNAYYSDAQTVYMSTTHQFIDISAGLWNSEAIKGNSVDNLQLLLRGYIVRADDSNWCRLIVFKWKPNTATSTPDASADQIIRNNGTAAAWMGFPHWEQRQQFKILFDKTYYVSSATTDSDSRTQVPVNIALSAKKLGRSHYGENVASGTDHIYLLHVSDSGVVAHPYLYYNLRMLYRGDN